MFRNLTYVLSSFVVVGVLSSSLPSKFLLESPRTYGSEALSIRLLRATWDGQRVSELANVGYGGNAYFDASNTVVLWGTLLWLPFKNRYYFEPAACNWQFEGTTQATRLYYYRLRA